MHRLGIWLLAAMAALVGSFPAQALEAEKLPAALRDWVEWVKHDHESAACPLLLNHDADGADSHVCAWPGELSIQASERGARFSQRWTVYARSAVPLPGDADFWPQQVRASTLPVPVVADSSGAPVVWLEPGNYQIEGQMSWVRRPESLPIPASIALVVLSVDGAAVFPVQREGNALWFGQADSAPKEADSLSVKVFRKLSDGIPAMLATQVHLEVSGEGREENIGHALPQGFVPTSIGGGLRAKLESDGTLKVQVRPGSWVVAISARADAPLTSVSRPEAKEPWPAQEIWSYEPEQRLRVTTPSAEKPIDPSQAGVPDEWAQLPAFLIEAGDKFAVEERSRGLSTQDQNRLNLSRELWLDFSGAAYRSKDRVSGKMVRDWRLEVAKPYRLVRAEENGEGLLVTASSKSGFTGVEVRNIAVNVGASTRVEGAGAKLPVTGWQQSLDSVSTVLNLPPGYRLYAALGADHAPESWIERWNLLDVFLVAVTTLLAAWLGGRAFGALALGYLLLAYQESDAPLWMLLIVIGVALAVKLMPEGGGFAKVLRWARNIALLVLILTALPFVAVQLRLALYPQLERYSADAAPGYGDSFGGANRIQVQQEAVALNEPMPMAVDAPPPQGMEEGKVMNAAPMPRKVLRAPIDKLESVEVVGSRIKRTDVETTQPVFKVERKQMAMQRYANNTLIQAGSGEPAWGWGRYQLSWAGPVLPAQNVRLVISPPWLTRLTRVILVGLLALLLARLAQLAFALRLPRAPGGAGAAAAVIATLALLGHAPAHAQNTPSDELLEELGKRVMAAPKCAPTCAHMASAEISAEGDVVRIALELHAAERVGVPLPSAEGQLAVRELRVDGAAESGVRRDDSGKSWIVVGRGVHRIEMSLRAAPSDKIGLSFPLKPARIVFAGREWEAEGVREERLLTDTLELVRVRKDKSAAVGGGAGQQFPPFVRVVRDISLGIDWTVTTNVQRLAPEQAAFSVALPLLPGERVQSTELKVEEGRITVPVQAGAGGATWSSQIDRADTLVLEAPALSHHAEVWRISASNMWNVVLAGVPAVYPENTATWVFEFHPLPGEKLTLAISRPEPVAGSWLAIDAATLSSAAGKRAADHTLDLTVRSTQGGQHVIEIPKDAEVLEVSVGGAVLNIRPENGKLGLPLKPGSQPVRVRWRENAEIGTLTRTPPVALHAQASNLRLNIGLPEDRWLLFVSGPRVGPAVLYWGEFVLMVLVAWGLTRLQRTPLRFHDWLLLGFGFSTASWFALVIVVLWLLALDARGRAAELADNTWFNLRQLALAAFTVVALFCIVGSLHKGLLGTPDMHLVGNASSPTALHWFHDQTDNALPQASAFSVPMWLYKTAMLAWALWLANAMVKWLRWGFASYSSGGYWRQRVKPAPMSRDEVSAAVEPMQESPPP